MFAIFVTVLHFVGIKEKQSKNWLQRQLCCLCFSQMFV